MEMAESSYHGLKTSWEKENFLVTSYFSFSNSVFKRPVLQTCKDQDLFRKGFNVDLVLSILGEKVSHNISIRERDVITCPTSTGKGEKTCKTQHYNDW